MRDWFFSTYTMDIESYNTLKIGDVIWNYPKRKGVVVRATKSILIVKWEPKIITWVRNSWVVNAWDYRCLPWRWCIICGKRFWRSYPWFQDYEEHCSRECADEDIEMCERMFGPFIYREDE